MPFQPRIPFTFDQCTRMPSCQFESNIFNINVAMEPLTPSSSSSESVRDDYDYGDSQYNMQTSTYKEEIPSNVLEIENHGNGYSIVNNNVMIQSQFDQQQWFIPNFNPKPATPSTPPNKSPKRARTQFTSHQLVCLEREFQSGKYLSRTKRISMAQSLNLTEKQIKVWFQNRRMKLKKDGKSRGTQDTASASIQKVSEDVPALRASPPPAQDSWPTPMYHPSAYFSSEQQYIPQGFSLPLYPDGSFRSDDYYQEPEMRSGEVWSGGPEIDNGGLTHL